MMSKITIFKPHTINLAMQILLAMLFVYSALTKLLESAKFSKEMLFSPLLPEFSIQYLVYVVPLVEIAAVVCLFYSHPTIRKIGFYLSFFMMLCFTLYLTVLYTQFANIPCACGGILGGMSYPVHIAFNIFFTLVALVGIYTNEDKPTSEPQTA